MIGKTISHYKILDKIGEASLHLGYGWQGGPVRPSWLGQAETGRSPKKELEKYI